jgi:hypothetical protein
MFYGLCETTNCLDRLNELKIAILPYYEHFCDIYDMYGGFGKKSFFIF